MLATARMLYKAGKLEQLERRAKNQGDYWSLACFRAAHGAACTAAGERAKGIDCWKASNEAIDQMRSSGAQDVPDLDIGQIEMHNTINLVFSGDTDSFGTDRIAALMDSPAAQLDAHSLFMMRVGQTIYPNMFAGKM